ncbi:MAG: type transport system permease protein [Thermoanaerobaculia bacterium]|jgi:ABC-2 type transport system permease protein|nr:type transport system permease protein [Thermoanaerobaculia bacterium]
MNKMFAVIKREYLQAVRKKMFIFMTIFFPVLMAALFIIPLRLMMSSMAGKKVAVIDGTGALRASFSHHIEPETPDPKKALRGGNRAELPQSLDVEYVDAHGQSDLTNASKPYLARLNAVKSSGRRLDSVLVIPSNAFEGSDAKMTFYSSSSTDLISQERLGSIANHAIQRQRLIARGLDQSTVETLTRSVPLDSVQLSKSGEQKKGGDANFIIGFIFAGLLLIPSFIYGLETMRGIVQEKSERIVEVLVSSMSPRQLLTGKIIGVAAVGLTQVTVWLTLVGAAGSFLAASAMVAGFNVSQFIRPMVFVYFALFFLLGYLTFVCIYAIAGAACNTDKEAQQLVAPIQMVMMVPWIVMAAIITNPDSTFAVVLSLMPVYGPITMFVRTLVSEPPVWHVLLSIAISIVTIFGFFYVTAKIFRVGILSYGKRPTIPELWRWLKVA